ncbi:MAG: SMC family ATPase [Phormidium sp. BM_Day4_Bin.17]|nr:SMC family ATPase [Phormidium sp. BM_Day4_Bin.17]UCJ13685.1 MAG: SMC family ATPase [Phormidium sp. PBR-2020]
MIPLHLTLHNFFSYQSATLDFSGLHTACICGENGAGKSSLLEAISWVVWGKSRANSEDDIIRIGQKEASVDFVFRSQEQVFRIKRSHRRGQSSSLEFQIETGQGFRSITGKGLRGTQHKIIEQLKLDYDTFLSSAYLRQGRADEFMVKKAAQRKQVLVDLLKLDHYDQLADKAREIANQGKAESKLLQEAVTRLETTLAAGPELEGELQAAEAEVAQLQAQQAQRTDRLQELQHQQAQRQRWQHQLDWAAAQGERLEEDYERDRRQQEQLREQQAQLRAILEQAVEIEQGYKEYQALSAKERDWTEQFSRYQDASQRQSQLRQELDRRKVEVQQQLHQEQAQLQACDRQLEQLQESLQREPQIQAGLAQLAQAKTQLQELEHCHSQAAPLRQRQQRLQGERDRIRAQLEARLEQQQQRQAQLEQRQAQRPQLEQALAQVSEQIEALDKLRVYHKRVKEKGLERRSFLDGLHGSLQEYGRRLGEMDQKRALLQDPDAACPLCDRPLDEHHWQLVAGKHEQQHQELRHQHWLIQEQIAISEREIQVLRQEYRQLEQQLADYDRLREERGQRQAQLAATQEEWELLQQVRADSEELARAIAEDDYAPGIAEELASVEEQLAALQYDERELALARGAVERYRWADLQNAQLEQSRRQMQQLQEQRPELQGAVEVRKQALQELESEGETARELRDLQHYIDSLDYDVQAHRQLRQQLDEAEGWRSQWQLLENAQQALPGLEEQLGHLGDRLKTRQQELEQWQQQMQATQAALADCPDCSQEMAQVQTQLEQGRSQLNDRSAQLGRLQQQQQHRQAQQAHLEEQRRQLARSQRQHRVYQELSQAFGKNGIQALTIETVLPQLEAEANQFLARLSANQLHVQFVTQRASKGSKKTRKLIDTLDIYIADARGTRAYETYSGGEAFRINFAIRLALAKLLAQRSGAALQLLVIDEGFGTQDDRGCERLVSAIEAIAPDFACILAVTHIPHLKEAFQTHVEVVKTDAGSQVCVSH